MSVPSSLLYQETSYLGASASDITLDMNPSTRHNTNPTSYTTSYLTSTFRSAPPPQSQSQSLNNMETFAPRSTKTSSAVDKLGQKTPSLSDRANSLRRQSSVALSAASRCMPSGFLQRAGSVLVGAKSAAVPTPAAEATRASPSQQRPTWLDSLGLTSAQHTQPMQSKYSRQTLSSRVRAPLSREPSMNRTSSTEDYTSNSADDEDNDNNASAYSADSYDTSNSISPSSQQHHFSLPTPLPKDPQALTSLLHELYTAYQAQTGQLRRAYLEADELADELEEARDHAGSLERRIARTVGGAEGQFFFRHGGLSGREWAGKREKERTTGLSSPPPLTPDIPPYDDGSFSSPSPSSIRTPSPPRPSLPRLHGAATSSRKGRNASPARSELSVLPEEEDERQEGFFGLLHHDDQFCSKDLYLRGCGRANVESIGLGLSGAGVSMYAENARLKARVCELEDVVEGVLGMVGFEGC